MPMARWVPNGRRMPCRGPCARSRLPRRLRGAARHPPAVVRCATAPCLIQPPLIEAFTDGGCLGNPGPGGWAFHLTVAPARVHEDSGAAAATTNNRMELIAVIQALRTVRDLPEACAAKVVVFTDSTYVQQGITSWIRRWRANGWLTAAKQPVKNAKLWRKLDEVASQTGAQFRWVRGARRRPAQRALPCPGAGRHRGSAGGRRRALAFHSRLPPAGALKRR